MQTRFPCSAEKGNCSFLISNSSFPQGRINPPIRGSIGVRGTVFRNGCRERINPPIRGSIEQDNALFENYNHKRQICQGRSSPFYWGNRDIFVCVKNVFNSTLHSPHSTPVNNSSTAPLSRKANEHFNPPIRGSIGETYEGIIQNFFESQSPYKGFNSSLGVITPTYVSLNPPIRGSIATSLQTFPPL